MLADEYRKPGCPGTWFKADVYLYETATGERRVYESEEYISDPKDGWSDFMWAEGNYACDSNRALFWLRAGNEDESKEWDSPHRCETSEYIVEKIVRKATGQVLYEESIPLSASLK